MAIPLLHKTDDEIARFVLRRGKELYEASRSRHKQAEAWQRLYLGEHPPASEMRASVHVPQVFSKVETIVPRMVGPFFGLTTSPFNVVGRKMMDAESEKGVEDLVWWRMQQDQYVIAFDSLCRSAVKFGNGWFQVIPKISRRKQFNRGYIFEAFGLKIGRRDAERTITEIRPHIKFLPYWDVWPDDKSSGYKDDDIYDICYRYWLRVDEIAELVAMNVFRKVNIQPEKESAAILEERRGIDPLPFIGNGKANMVSADSVIDRVECWRYETKDYFIIIAPTQNVLLMADKNQFWHQMKTIQTVPYTPHEGSVWGIGMIEHIESLQLELDDKRNQRLDIVNLIINPAVKVKRGVLRDEKDFRLWPGRPFYINDASDITPFVLPDSARPTHFEEDRLRADIEQTTAVTEFIQGTRSSGDVTATEVDLKARFAMNRFEYQFKVMVDRGLRVPAEMVLALDQQYLSEQIQIRVLGDKMKYPILDGDAVQGQYDFYTVIDPTRQDDRIKSRTLTELGNFLKEVPGFNMQKYAEKLIGLNGFDPDEFISPIQEGAMAMAQTAMRQPGMQMIPPINENGNMLAEAVYPQ